MQRKVCSTRNSTCSARLSALDWSTWFTDSSFGAFYLHVTHMDGESVHRVRCRLSERPRLQSRKGVLYWIIDKEPK